jgi:hypothetical protein
MQREDVIQLAREAGFVVDEDSKRYQSNCISHTWYLIDEGLERFANAIEQRTLERAAQMCEERKHITPDWQLDQHYNQACGHCAAAIRALKGTL